MASDEDEDKMLRTEEELYLGERGFLLRLIVSGCFFFVITLLLLDGFGFAEIMSDQDES